MKEERGDYKPASNSVDQLQVPVEPETLELGEDVEGRELGSSYFDNFVRKIFWEGKQILHLECTFFKLRISISGIQISSTNDTSTGIRESSFSPN